MTVDEIIAGLERAWNAGDGAAWAAYFAEDADYVDALGRMQKGRGVITGEHRKILETIYRDSRLRMRLLAARPIAKDTLLVHTATTLRVAEGPRAGEWHSVQTQIHRNGLIIAFHNTIRTDVAEFAEQDDEFGSRSPLGWDAKGSR